MIESPETLDRMRRSILQRQEAQKAAGGYDSVVQVKVSMATCGIASGAQEIMRFFSEELAKRGIEAEVTQTGCQGFCYAEPTLEVILPGGDSRIFGYVDIPQADLIIEQYIKNGTEVTGILSSGKKQLKIALRNCGIIDPESMDDAIGYGAYQALAKALTNMDPSQVIDEVKKSGLRGRGGGEVSLRD